MKQENKIHSRARALIFRGKVSILQSRRAFKNLFDSNVKRFAPSANLEEQPVIAESKTPFWTETEPKERFLVAGKIHNLRLAIKKINNVEIPAGETFSFWKQIGKASHRRNYAVGRELREGCVIPSIGGGLCQLSNALYDAALRANFEIVERHRHSQIVPGSLAEQGRDATVFWNYVDLRFRSPASFRIEAELDRENLIVRFKSETRKKDFVQISNLKRKNPSEKEESLAVVNSCATCGAADCFRAVEPYANLDFGHTAFLVDEYSPEFDEFIQKTKSANDVLFVPLDGRRFKKTNYAWTQKGFAKIRQSLFVTFVRSYKSRKLAAQGAERQINLLQMYEKLANSYAKNLSPDVLHLVVQQNLLPFLWREGVLGGRTFDVLMTALPMRVLQERLNFAASLHAESKTLGDFRADESLVEAEMKALRAARKIITPHTEIARVFSDKAEVLDWKLPAAKKYKKTRNGKFTIVFPASTVGRKGCYELREAIKNLDVKLITLGAQIEGADFWKDFDVERNNADWLEIADAVVLPAFVEHKPRRLLQAIARKIPVIASGACGIENVPGVQTVNAGEADALREKLLHIISGKK